MMNIPARITGLMTSAEMGELRNAATAEAVADHYRDEVVGQYTDRDVPHAERKERDSMALYHLMGGLEYYLRTGGDPAVMKIVSEALDFAASL